MIAQIARNNELCITFIISMFNAAKIVFNSENKVQKQRNYSEAERAYNGFVWRLKDCDNVTAVCMHAMFMNYRP